MLTDRPETAESYRTWQGGGSTWEGNDCTTQAMGAREHSSVGRGTTNKNSHELVVPANALRDDRLCDTDSLRIKDKQRKRKKKFSPKPAGGTFIETLNPRGRYQKNENLREAK